MTLSRTEIEALPLIGAFTNKWRNRKVYIYEDPEDETMVYAVGISLDDERTNFPTHEPKADYKRYIGTYNKVYE